jgi:hypothetical protein
VSGEGVDFHSRRDAESNGPHALHEIEYRCFLAAWHPDGRGGIGRGFAACAWSGTASFGLGHGDLLNSAT